ncbi:hypothetical protein [Mucilaginibacter myungsuensis]|uniref:Uncharacterized protein n=1 Tax=Mucilaginibacter myungsuensis TaxID=649104 RepID=A0A929L042_9SPHI|nr:hypothetical protein [Mucilaginibacter myungsuensis]MBE9663797.1 hypothetical protein [Mucilaginibacter myungsuensis]MDN3598488.1 hypothetical protein [Mucilaginibacter myungsuensis]
MMRKVTAVLILALAFTGLSQAQDSLKPKTLKPVVKPTYAQPGATKYRTPNTYQAKPAAGQPSVTTSGTAPVQQPVQYGETPVSTDKSLRGQYQYILSKTYRYQQPMIAALWKNINDTLNATKRTLNDTKAQLAEKTKSVATLQSDAKNSEQTLADATSMRDEIGLLGIPMSKSAYNILMWGLVIGMGLVLVIVILRTGGANREAKYRVKLYEELSEEFTAYKAKANDKEKKLARELQTERNKVDELMGRG